MKVPWQRVITDEQFDKWHKENKKQDDED